MYKLVYKVEDIRFIHNEYDTLREVIDDLNVQIQQCKEKNIKYKDLFYIVDENNEIIFVS